MAQEIEWFVGVDWASQSHQVCLVDARGECSGERAVAHGGLGIEELCDWLIVRTSSGPIELLYDHPTAGQVRLSLINWLWPRWRLRIG